jgi:V/A-type H+/Na+-transporting ATPase subunit I
LYFLIVLILWGGSSLGVINLPIAKYLVWLGVAGIVLTQGRKAKNPFLKFVNGVISLYGVVGYLSDVLSYSRLLALGLATGIIAMVINLIAVLTIDMVPYFGYLIALAIIIGGHIFNISINALGSFIHASRLQYVEFFPKFMEGGGTSLAPVRKEHKYTKII